MFKFLQNMLSKRRFLKSINYLSDTSIVIFGKDTEIHTTSTSNIEINGKLYLGIPLNGIRTGFSHKANTIISLGKNSSLIIKGNVQIAPGCTIRVGDNAVVEFGGENLIAHDTTIIATKKICIGKNTSISWNCNLIDDDGHSFYRSDGKKIKRIRKALLIGDNVGIQMNVVIPSGGMIGDNSIISANTVVRTNVPADTLIYTANENKLITNFTTGFKFL